MTQLQKQFYRAVYESNVKFLLQLTGKKKQKKSGGRDDEGIVDKVSVPSLMNVCMQLRHVCNVSAEHTRTGEGTKARGQQIASPCSAGHTDRFISVLDLSVFACSIRTR